MTDTEALPGLAVLNDAVLRLQKSARRTIPMFFVGIVATLIAAGVAVYYIFTLSADLHDARRALQQSQGALAQARADLALVGATLRKSQSTTTSPAAASTLATALTDVARSQNNLNAASSSINAAAVKISENAGVAEQNASGIAGSCRLIVNSVTYLTGSCRIQMTPGGSFSIYSNDSSGPSASVKREGPLGIGSWQAGPGQASVALGQLQRHGACWSNDTASVCAWR